MSSQNKNSETSIARYGVSDQLISEFDMLREVNCAEGSIKFSSETVNTLAQHIVCRHYGNLCYEFAHLNWSIIYANSISISDRGNSIQNEMVNYYWIEQCHWPQYFKKYFYTRCLPLKDIQKQAIALSINNDIYKDKNHRVADNSNKKSGGITLHIHDHTFSISASRANILACFMEWLICIIPDLLITIEERLLGKGHNAIREFSSFLQKHIYDYLSQHLPPAKLQQRFRVIQDWYNTPPHTEINDSNLLVFWQQHSTVEGYGKYSNVVKDSLSYLRALALVKASTNIQHANSTNDLSGLKDDLSMVEDNLHFDWASQYCAQAILPIHRLMEAPKALNKQQVELLELFSLYPQSLLPLSATWLRLQVFGKVQHQIIQMLRVKDRLAGNTQHYEKLCETDYQQIKLNCIRLMANNQQTLLAISQIMLSFSSNQSCLILLKLMPQVPSLAPYAKDFLAILENVENAEEVITRKQILQWQLSYPWINTMFKQTQLALQQINRHGFTPSTLLPSDDYLQCAELLFDLNKLIKQIVNKINKHEQDSHCNYQADRLIFINEFTRLYAKDEN